LGSLRAPEGGKSDSMKRSLGKKMTLMGWAIGSCGAVLFSCWWIGAIIYTRKVNFGLLSIVALGIVAALEGFKMFRSERNSK
jgi:hypothetical protein